MTPQPTNAGLPHEVVFPTNLPETDGEPLESDWHRLAINLLVEGVRYYFRDRRDFFAGGNLFLYYSARQAKHRDYRGPDFFFVWGVERDKLRNYYAVWEEDGKYPAVIIELLSPTTAQEDRTTKKKLYERTFNTPEYFLYDPEARRLEGYRLHGLNYEPIEPEQDGRLWSKALELYLGLWEGPYLETYATYPRFFDVHGNLIRIGREDETRRANEEKRRADAAEAELARLRERLAKLETPDDNRGAGL